MKLSHCSGVNSLGSYAVWKGHQC